jgi:hypothetical protein
LLERQDLGSLERDEAGRPRGKRREGERGREERVEERGRDEKERNIKRDKFKKIPICQPINKWPTAFIFSCPNPETFSFT